jgi:DNA modification methylase
MWPRFTEENSDDSRGQALNFDIHQGDALDVLRGMPDASVHCCITSPPYWGLRDYGMKGQLGLERTPAEYVEKMVEVFREVRRVLRDDGTLWLNLGDSYAGSWGNYGGQNRGGGSQRTITKGSRVRNPAYDGTERQVPPQADVPGLKPKDLCGIPWRVALALQADGWYWRDCIVWHKPAPMPESVRDRCTKAWEPIFMFAKSERYYFDADAIRESLSRATIDRDKKPRGRSQNGGGSKESVAGYDYSRDGLGDMQSNPDGRNKRNVWTLSPMATPDAHFATFPLELPETCLKAGTEYGGTVLDPFAGAGTTGLACLKQSRNFVGIELNPAYIEIAYNRARKYYPLLMEATA